MAAQHRRETTRALNARRGMRSRAWHTVVMMATCILDQECSYLRPRHCHTAPCTSADSMHATTIPAQHA
eukprot:2733025-Lingulodinium_polyedra.AAC.1